MTFPRAACLHVLTHDMVTAAPPVNAASCVSAEVNGDRQALGRLVAEL